MSNAKELSRTFDLAHAAVVVIIGDELGRSVAHTLYVTGDAGVSDVDAAVAALLTRTDTETAQIMTRMQAAGWSA